MATDIEPTSNQTGRSKAKDEIAKDIHVEQAETKRVPRPEGVNSKSPILWSYLIPVLVFHLMICLLYTSPSPRDATLSRMPSSA